MTCTSPLDFGSVTIGMSQTLNVSCTANIPITSFNGFISSKAIYQVSNSSLPTGGLSAGSTFTFPVTFNLENLQLSAGSSSSPQVSPGVQTASIEILTTNGVAGFESTQPVTVTGMSISGTPFISINPLQVDFAPIVVGSAAAATGSSNTFVINNEGQSPMTILGLAWTNGSVSAATTVFRNMTAGTDSRGNPATVFDGNGYFTSNNMPNVGTVIPAGASITVNSEFNSNVSTLALQELSLNLMTSLDNRDIFHNLDGLLRRRKCLYHFHRICGQLPSRPLAIFQWGRRLERYSCL